MRAGRFGHWLGRTAAVVALGAVVLVAGASAAGAAELTGGSPGSAIGQAAQASAAGMAHTLDTGWE
jgi:hypothetical protein